MYIYISFNSGCSASVYTLGSYFYHDGSDETLLKYSVEHELRKFGGGRSPHYDSSLLKPCIAPVFRPSLDVTGSYGIASEL
jgi:hypothetical protein